MSSTEKLANERPDDSPESTAIPQSSHIDDNSTVTSVALLPPPMSQLNESGSDIEINPTAQSTNDHEGQSKGTYTGKNIGKEISESKRNQDKKGVAASTLNDYWLGASSLTPGYVYSRYGHIGLVIILTFGLFHLLLISCIMSPYRI